MAVSHDGGSLEYNIFPLHKRKDLLEVCAQMLNDEWKRSFGSRSNMLLKSNDDLPISLLLVECFKDKEELVGHLRFSSVVGNPHAVLMSSVIITMKRRRQGLGKRLLQMAHEYLKGTQYAYVYLRTDTPEFYEKVGYKHAEPVDSFNTRNATLTCSIANLQKLMKPQHIDETKSEEKEMNKETENHNTVTRNQNIVLPPPPPPPPVKVTNAISVNKKTADTSDDAEDNGKIWLKRKIFQTDKGL